jgi:hypothetical protein
MANEVVQRGIVARLKASFGAQGDGNMSGPAGQRYSKFGESYALTLGSPKSLLAEEGSYFVTNNNQTGLATAAAPTTFSATNPFLLIQNPSSAGAGVPTVITLDYMLLAATAAGTAGTSVQCAITKDTTLRYSSGGSTLTAIRANSGGPNSIAQVYAGNITASAASGAAVTLVGQRTLKPAIPVAGDNYWLQMGTMDGIMLISTATITFSNQGSPPVILNPGESALLHIWLPSQSAASSYAPEMGWWER